MCATRPLTVQELQTALKLDIDQEFDHLERAIVSLCGQMVYVDKHMRVQMVHETARAFLLRNDLDSEFAINPTQGHTRLARVCLTYLNSDDMKGSGVQRVGRGPPRKKSPFLDYACTSYSEHIRNTCPADSTIAHQLDAFLRSNILSWIEYVAGNGTLYHMTHTAEIFQEYLQQSTERKIPLTPELQQIKAWATNLNRLAAKFGEQILECPNSIYGLVPQFCPEGSVIASQFGTVARGLTVLGISDTTWSDQLSCIDYQSVGAAAVACGERCFAVGLSSGDVKLYNVTTCQERMTLEHGEWVDRLEFSASGQLLVSSGLSEIKIWNIETGKLLWEKTDERGGIMTFTFAFDDAVLMAATPRHTVCSWNVSDGAVIEDVEWGVTFRDESSRRPPKKAAFSPDWNLLAIIYHGRPIILWDLEARCFAAYLGREKNPAMQSFGSNTSAENLIFSSDPNICRLAVAYEDGDLAFFDADNQILLQCTPESAQMLACSPDGRTLATGNWNGVIRLFDFESMKPIYQINRYEYSVTSLTFNSNNLRLFDIRNTQLNIWEPSVLLQRNRDKRIGNPVLPPPATIEMKGLSGEVEITTNLSG